MSNASAAVVLASVSRPVGKELIINNAPNMPISASSLSLA